MARRILNRKDLRADYEAAERRKEEDLDEEEETEEEEEEEELDEDLEEEVEEVEDEEEVTRKRKAVKEPKPKTKLRRSAKLVRMKVVWGVFNNSNQRVAVYEYPRRKEAEEHASRLTAEKKSTHFVQPVKEPMEEKKEG